jgi:hypothetical protein
VTPAPNDPRAAQRSSLRRAVLELVLGVVVLDAVALSIYHFADTAHRPANTQTMFVAIWTAATAITVAVLLRRVRLARRR